MLKALICFLWGHKTHINDGGISTRQPESYRWFTCQRCYHAVTVQHKWTRT